MKEELYIYNKEGVMQSVDLNTPSGITLKWVSNLFNSLDKVNCSYSYTFNIPLTRHNREVFDYAEDIRHLSGIIGKKIKAHFVLNGIPLFQNANLYIDKSANNTYSCVLTWNLIEGLQKLNDEGCNLNELREALVKAGYDNDELTDEGWVSGNFTTDSCAVGTFRNGLKTLAPYYQAGVPFTIENKQENNFFGEFSLCYPRPVMPTYYLLNVIGKAFGVSFNLGKEKSEASDLKTLDDKNEVFSDDNIVSFGCVPLIKSEMTENQLQQFTMYLEPNKINDSDKWKNFFVNHKILGQENVLSFNNGDSKFDAPQDERPYIFNLYMNISNKSEIGGGVQMKPASNLTQIGFATPFEADVELKFRIKSTKFRYDTWAEKDDGKVQLVIFSRKTATDSSEYEYDEITKIKPAFCETHYKNGGDWDYDILTFDTLKNDGFDSINVGEEQVMSRLPKYYFFKLSLGWCECVDFDVMRITPKINDAKFITHYMDTFTNLPDIDCLAFVKSLFYMMGKYPQVTADGVIRGLSYNELRENIQKGKVYDWSKYIIGRTNNAEEVTFNVGDFKQHNYYMTKWDDLDRTKEDLEDEEDVYEDGVLDINVNCNHIDKEQTVYQSVFYPPYILNRKSPNIPTGNTVKGWSLEVNSLDEPTAILAYGGKQEYVFFKVNEHLSMCESKPAYGILHCRPLLDESGNAIQNRYMRMDILNPFKDAPSTSSFAYLQEIVRNPFVITENLRLSEYTLMDLDFSRPVYLDKYCCYFAIISIQLGSNSISKCELVKLPTE